MGEGGEDARRIAVLDFGKTNLKLNVCDAAGHVLETLSTANETRAGPPSRHHDLRGLGEWMLAGLADLCRRHDIGHFVPTGHGSGGALVGEDPDASGDGAALPMIDYEDAMPPDIDAAYRALAGSFFDRGSAVMMASTHAARQLFRMTREEPEVVRGARWFLNVAQYWGWRLSGVAVSEYTAMGAQSQFWNVAERRFAPIVGTMGWERLMPAFAPAWTSLGPIRPDLCRRYGLPEGIAVHVGAHDSSANFYRYQAAGIDKFMLVSTGTWIVALTRDADLARLDETRGMTLNADTLGRPVAGALCMGGREFSLIAGPDWATAKADTATVARLIGQGTFAVPSFGENDGQFPGTARRGRIAGPPPATPGERRSLAVLHAALLTAEVIATLDPKARVILDGSFLGEPLYAPLVAALRPGAVTEVSTETTGAAAGAALLATHAVRPGPVPVSLAAARPPMDLPDLSRYAMQWRDLAKDNAR